MKIGECALEVEVVGGGRWSLPEGASPAGFGRDGADVRLPRVGQFVRVREDHDPGFDFGPEGHLVEVGQDVAYDLRGLQRFDADELRVLAENISVFRFEKDELIMKAMMSFGQNWQAVSQRVPGRSAHAVRNRFLRELRSSTLRTRQPNQPSIMT